jgi:hypothetical protein
MGQQRVFDRFRLDVEVGVLVGHVLVQLGGEQEAKVTLRALKYRHDASSPHRLWAGTEGRVATFGADPY